MQHGLVTARREVRDELHQPTSGVGDARGDRGELVAARVIAGDRRSARGLVEGEPRRCKAKRPHLDGFLGQRPHLRKILVGRRLAVGAALAHHVHPQRRVRQIRGDINVPASRL